MSARLVAVLVLTGGTLWGQEPGMIARVSLDYELVAALGRIADTATVEQVRCLGGDRVADTLFLNRAIARPTVEASDSSLVAVGCPPGTFAIWHTHILRPGQHPLDVCFLSEDDIHTAVRARVPMQIVQVSSALWCYWGLHQIVYALEGRLLWPKLGQVGEPPRRP